MLKYNWYMEGARRFMLQKNTVYFRLQNLELICLCSLLTSFKMGLKQNKLIKEKYTYIVKEDGGIAMAQLANLPSRLFHILFGQPPMEGEKKHKMGNIRLKTQDDATSAVSKDGHFCKLHSN